jgi:acyl transferase domain-containing protein
MLAWHLEYLNANPDVTITDLAYTLQHRRSTLPYRKSIAAKDFQAAIRSLEDIQIPPSGNKEDSGLDTRFITMSRSAKVIGIFTGQGAQWARMGAELIESSPFAASRLAEQDAALQNLPNAADRPSWTLRDQLLAPEESSRIAEAALSQPLCTAVQIILVDILRAAGVCFTAVVGHSSGEIGAAYAAGYLSAQDAIRIAYFRGVHAKLASSPSPHSPRGAMMAIGASAEDAEELCRESCFIGRIQVAAVNSTSSVTLSGDEDAIDEAESALKAKGTFARKLKVDTAYHSAHMASCAESYLASLSSCDIKCMQPGPEVTTTWFSSVYEGMTMTKATLTNQYWADNMCNTVLFAGALYSAVQQNDAFDMAIEVGPHAALKGSASATLDAFRGETSTPYSSLLSRGQSDVEQLSSALGYVWTRLGSESVRFSAVQALLSGNEDATVLQDLPPYPFDHHRSYWTRSRLANHFKHRNPAHVTNPVLGNPCSEAITPGEFQWRKILQPSEMPSLLRDT